MDTFLRENMFSELPVYLRSSSVDGAGDTGFIVGKVTEKGLPVARVVRCHHRRTGALIAETISDDSGHYAFNNLVNGVEYYILSVDDSDDGVQYNAVIQDSVLASPK